MTHITEKDEYGVLIHLIFWSRRGALSRDFILPMLALINVVGKTNKQIKNNRKRKRALEVELK